MSDLDPRILYKLVEEFRLQCRFLDRAWKQLQEALVRVDEERCFAGLQDILSIGSILVSFSDDLDGLSSPYLREISWLAGLREESSVAALKKVSRAGSANGLVRWLESLGDDEPADMSLMPAGTLSGFKADLFQRRYDPESHEFTFRGEAIRIRELVKTINLAEKQAVKWLNRHNPW